MIIKRCFICQENEIGYCHGCGKRTRTLDHWIIGGYIACDDCADMAILAGATIGNEIRTPNE